MTVREFINNIATGEFSDSNDILNFSKLFPDIEELIWSLKLADIACLESTGKPQISDDKQISRIKRAIEILSKSSESSASPQKQQQEPLKPVHQVNVPTESKKPAKERILDAISNKTGIFKYNAVSESVLAAIEKKLISFTDTGLKWERSNVLLAYFFGRLICGDTIKEGAMDKKMHYFLGMYGNEPFPAKELEDLFGVTSLKQARNNRRGEAAPKGYKEIEKYIIR